MAKLKIENKVYSAKDCLLPPIATRIVLNNGCISLLGDCYQHHALSRYAGQEVMLFRLDADTLGVCLGSDFICAAVAPDYLPPARYRVGDTVYVRSLNKLGVIGDVSAVMQTYIYRVRLYNRAELSDFYAEQLSLELTGEDS